MNFPKLTIGDIVEIDKRLYKVYASKWQNQSEWTQRENKSGNWQGLKITLKLLREKELNELIIKEKNNENQNN